MSTKYIFKDIAWTLQDVKLGSLIPALNRPNQDTFGPLKVLIEGEDFSCRAENDVSIDFGDEGKSSLELSITKFLRLLGSKAKSQSTKLESKQARIHELKEPKLIFKALIANDKGKEWLDAAREEGEEPHLIVGYKTHLDASMKTEFTGDTTTEVAANIPTGAIARLLLNLSQTKCNIPGIPLADTTTFP